MDAIAPLDRKSGEEAAETEMTEAIPKVYLFCNSGWGTEWQVWYAMHEDGRVLGSHISSSRFWGLRDSRPPMKAEGYAEAFGPDAVEGKDYEVVEVPERQGPPPEVVARNEALGAAAKAEAEQRERDVDACAGGMGGS
jgi:hypothetical protein